MSRLFQLGAFPLHSGEVAPWKIECDALSGHELDAIAFMLSEILPTFSRTIGVPRGGRRLALKLSKYASEGPVLIVDDVLTTGASMEAQRFVLKECEFRAAIGAVIFARGPCPAWVTPLFAMPAARR